MGRNRKPSGNGRCYDPVPNSADFKQRVCSEDGRIEKRNGGSHFQAYLNGEQITAYECDEYPRGMACSLGKWLAKAILKSAVVVAAVVAVAMLLS